MNRIIDISVPISAKIPVWPGSTKPRITPLASIKKGDGVNESGIEMSVHTGTHIDAPLHFIKQGESINKIALDVFMGPAYVAHLPKVKAINEKVLKGLRIPRGVSRILFKTSNSSLWQRARFQDNYVGIARDGAEWLVRKNFKLIGVDYLSVAKFDEAVKVHQILLKEGIALLEGLNLSVVRPGIYQLICLPLKITDTEAAPARAVLLTND